MIARQVGLRVSEKAQHATGISENRSHGVRGGPSVCTKSRNIVERHDERFEVRLVECTWVLASEQVTTHGNDARPSLRERMGEEDENDLQISHEKDEWGEGGRGRGNGEMLG